MDHYFTDKSPKNNRRIEFSFRFLGVSLQLQSESGIFSKDHVDYGTQCLIETAYHHGLKNDVLDLGCGIGVVSLVLKKITPTLNLTGVDINSRAVECAKQNANTNQLDIEYKHQDGLAGLKHFDAILLNPPIRAGKKAIYDLFDQSMNHLKSEGSLFIVMRKQHGANSAIAYLENQGFTTTILKRSKGFWVFQVQHHTN